MIRLILANIRSHATDFDYPSQYSFEDQITAIAISDALHSRILQADGRVYLESETSTFRVVVVERSRELFAET